MIIQNKIEKVIDVAPLKNAKVIFVVGGPGSGKVSLFNRQIFSLYS
jgi:hypothetical protein